VIAQFSPGDGMADSFFDEQSEQSQIKAAIVTDYLWAWAGFMVQQQKQRPQYGEKIQYIDLFAGPGRYENGAKSTPLMILERAVNDPEISKRLCAIFNDKDERKTQSLEEAIKAIPGYEKLKNEPKIYTGEVGEEVVKQFQKMRLVPTFLFVDPFGYKGLSLQLVQSVLKDWGCDCVFFFNYNRISMGIGNQVVEEHMDALFGKQRADALRERFEMRQVSPAEREMFIVDEMRMALEAMGGKFVLPFRFRNEDGSRTTHHLFFVSKAFRGYDLMKKVMYQHSHKEGTVANFEYNPADARFASLFEYTRPLGDLEDRLLADLAGKTLVFKTLYEMHSVGKPYVLVNYREVLCRMEQQGKVKMDPPSPPRRKNTLAEHVKITFPGRP
jgi:three-Cys-motif partner protein